MTPEQTGEALEVIGHTVAMLCIGLWVGGFAVELIQKARSPRRIGKRFPAFYVVGLFGIWFGIALGITSAFYPDPEPISTEEATNDA